MEEKDESLAEKAVKSLLEVVAGLVAGYSAAEVYDRVATPQQKKKWESLVQTHHGEAGVVAAGGGIAIKSPFVAGVGLGLMAHDIKDAKEWFSGDKQRMYARKA